MKEKTVKIPLVLVYLSITTFVLMTLAVVFIAVQPFWPKSTSSLPSLSPTPTPSGKRITQIGMIRTTGLTGEEKAQLELRYSDFQLTDFKDNSKQTPAGYFLETNNPDILAWQGHCVEVTGLVPSEWEKGKTEPFSYQRSLIVPEKISPLADYDSCQPAAGSAAIDCDKDRVTLRGFFVLAKRPAPDIPYDYQLQLAETFHDKIPGGAGESDYQVLDVMFFQKDSWLKMNATLGQEVVAEGCMNWGYAESRYLAVDKVYFPEETEIKRLIFDFEKAVSQKDVNLVMSFFTPPANAAEDEIYASIMGNDTIKLGGGPRLFNNVASNFVVEDWRIAIRPDGTEMIERQGNNNYRVTVSETRKGWSPVIGGYSESAAGLYTFEIEKQSSRWLINRYYWNEVMETEKSLLKYRGLGF